MARAVQLGRAVPHNDDRLDMPEVPNSVGRYATCHPDRVEKFPDRPREVSPIWTGDTDLQWRHELDHDVESVFWLLLYLLMGAQPENEEKEPIVANIWTALTGPVKSRIHLLRGGLDDITHSVFEPLWPMLNKLARIVNIDRHWVEPSNPRNDPGYINEAFQRLIYQFILEHRNAPFMRHPVESQPRRPKQMSGFLSSQSVPTRKRPLHESEPEPEPEHPGGLMRGTWRGARDALKLRR
jgi:hypothetical protein